MTELAISKISRRHVLFGMAGATAVTGAGGLWLVLRRVRGWRFRNPVDRGGAFAPSAYLAVENDGNVVIWLVRSEMGQGVETSLPLLVAEELDADWSRIRVERAIVDGRTDYGPMATVASASMSSMWIELRRAGAVARHMLLAAAAQRWAVPVDTLSTDMGWVTHDRSGRRASYGELAELANEEWPPLRPRLKQTSEFKLIGTRVPRRDLPAKVAGEARFGLDTRVPGMLVAVIERSPTLGGAVGEIDDAESRAVHGVVDVLEVPSGIAVVGTNTYAALRGRDALAVRWTRAHPPVSSHEISAALHAAVRSSQAVVARDDGGNRKEVVARAELSATYEVPYLAHAPMEPMNCTAQVSEGGCEVWAPTQTPDDAMQVAARITGLPVDRIAIHTTYMGGGFGRRAATDFVAEAVDLAVRLKRPVQVMWTREDDTRNGFYRPAVVQKIDATLERGYPSSWVHRIASVSAENLAIDRLALMGADDLPYSVGPQRIEWAGVQAPVPTMIWRSVGHSFTAFAIESFIDELAQDSGLDPVDYRLAMLPASSRLRACISEVALASDWHRRKAKGEYVGVAAASCFGSHIALVLQVAMDESAGGRLRVSRAWCVVDCGIVVNPDCAEAQVEGGILFALSAVLKGKITVSEGRIVEGNFDTYPLLRFDEIPEMQIRFIPSSESPGGLGELGVPPVAPAVANALFAIKGRRLRTLPIDLSV